MTSPPPVFVFDSGKFQWGMIELKKGGKKFSGKLQMEKSCMMTNEKKEMHQP